ncbi:MAG TPA: HNH endonuclease [Solirubrobacterales bacterium]|nr:HNH endonuclease [Solirubrobacterales bacterium]
MPYGDANWKRVSAQVVAGNACVRCERPAEHAHHVLPRAFGGPDDPSNLVPVCSRCHPSLERVARQKAYWLGYRPVAAGEAPRRVERARRVPSIARPGATPSALTDLLVQSSSSAARRQ